MDLDAAVIRGYRLRAHHLDRKLPWKGLAAAAGACGLQNSPPGAWETALFQRLEGCTEEKLHDVLYRQKSLLQAWSCRGVPMVFPTGQSGVFLAPLMGRPEEQPWIYTRGITAALDFLQMPLEDVWPLVRSAAKALDHETVQSKEALDQFLADRVRPHLPQDRRLLWDAPSMYGRPDRQTVGGAVVSFLLRPCSFEGLVVFGRREEGSPTFTSLRSWTGREPAGSPEGEKELVRRFLHCYGPTTSADLISWLGCSTRQGRRLWNLAAEEVEPVQVDGKTSWMLAADMPELLHGPEQTGRLLLLGPHDPYLELRDRQTILEDTTLQRQVWRTVSNPGAVLLDGRVAGIWQTRTQGGRMTVTVTLWEPLSPEQQKYLQQKAEEYAVFRGCTMNKYVLKD